MSNFKALVKTVWARRCSHLGKGTENVKSWVCTRIHGIPYRQCGFPYPLKYFCISCFAVLLIYGPVSPLNTCILCEIPALLWPGLCFHVMLGSLRFLWKPQTRGLPPLSTIASSRSPPFLPPPSLKHILALTRVIMQPAFPCFLWAAFPVGPSLRSHRQALGLKVEGRICNSRRWKSPGRNSYPCLFQPFFASS